jgi:hypothetical protein
MGVKITDTAEIAKDLARFYDDPLGFVMWCFPWGEIGTPLSDAKGPRSWQREQLIQIGKEVKRREFNGIDPVDPVQMSTTSGHGVGISCYTAWLIMWIMSTRPFAKGTVTANTSDQLRTKTWAELAKWYNMSMVEDMFTYRATRGNMCLYNKHHPNTWRVDAQTSKDENSESFAGQHVVNSSSFYIFDEASGISDKIFEVAQGGLTDGEPFWFLFGNPTRNTGFFRETFRNQGHRWINSAIDSREVEGAINVKLTEQWAEDYGEDSDFFKVRVKGEFPASASNQLINTESVEAAYGKHLRDEQFSFAPVILGVDVARYGGDSSVIYLRQGLMSKMVKEFKGIDLMTLANHVAAAEDEYNANAVFIDVGMGAGVIDRLRQLGRSPLEVNFGGKSTDKQCFNKRAQMWWRLKKWLDGGAAITRDKQLQEELTAQEYLFKNDKILLVSKEDMKRASLKSPDRADALALTFAEEIKTLDEETLLRRILSGQMNRSVTDYDPLS